jgi:Tat protein secretion system quality control protein TatD with DNase activity
LAATSKPVPASARSASIFTGSRTPRLIPAQRKVLEYFIAAAREQKKFVNLHTKAGEKEILDLLERYDIKRAIIHWYSGPMDILRALIDYGCYFTIGVEVLYSDYIKQSPARSPTIFCLPKPITPVH